jgi:hypothetical protein
MSATLLACRRYLAKVTDEQTKGFSCSGYLQHRWRGQGGIEDEKEQMNKNKWQEEEQMN